jgi:ApaG protein
LRVSRTPFELDRCEPFTESRRSGTVRGLVSVAITQGIRVSVSTQYVPEQSSPKAHRYVFAYTIRIANEGPLAAQLKSRHWIITDGNGKVEEVRGPGVVGQQPTLRPGEQFEYTSGCVLTTPRGEMQGSYQMHRPDGSRFEASIAPFRLALPHTLN